MNLNALIIDRLSITLSSLCVAHCLVFPLLAVLAPNVITLGLASEDVHFWLVLIVIPSSVLALALGCKKHAKLSVFLTGTLGLTCLLLTFYLGGAILGEFGEKALTVVGSLIIAFAHIQNFKLCKKQDNCGCSGASKA